MKRWWLIPAVLLVVIVFGAISCRLFNNYQQSQIDPRELLTEALDRTGAARSFRYDLESTLLVEGRKEEISRIQGEKSPEGHIHIKGEMVKTPVDIYHFDQAIYNWDSFSQRWTVIKDAQTDTTKVLISELDPLSNFNFKKIGEIKTKGWETIDGRKCMIVNCKPSVENELMEVLWRSFDYNIYVDVKEKLVRKATLSATSKNNADTYLKMTVSFKDFNEKISIGKPKID
ncbi:MAG: hypothetical protein GX052_08715 [Syntrophomonadaceae bacterium]|jgi:hypothetical protein|nr:hypothetical protein [Syntrophomonadaceae bacterium]